MCTYLRLNAAASIIAVVSLLLTPALTHAIDRGSMLVGYSFDAGDASDVSGNGADGAVEKVVPVAGKIGGAMEFDGSDGSYIATPDLGVHERITISVWFKMAGRAGSWRTIYSVNGWSPGWVHHQIYPDDQLGFSINGNPGGGNQFGDANYGGALVDGEWHHSAVVYDAPEGTIRFYLDGQLEGEAAWAGNPGVLGPARIGAWDGGGRGFDGALDEFVILNVAASEADIAELASGETIFAPVIPDEAFLAHYSFDDGTGADASAAVAHGEVMGAASAVENGKIGGALQFDGSDDQFVATPDLGEHEAVTISLWFRMTGRVGAWRTLYSVNGWSPGWVHHQMYTNNRLGFSINGNPGGSDSFSDATYDDALLGQWHHSAAIYDAATMKIRFYLDGALVGDADWGGNSVVLGPAQIGAWDGGGRGFEGLLDEVVILNIAANDEQIADLANDPDFDPRLRPVIAKYTFDDATATDASESANHGVVAGATRAAGKFGGALAFDGSDDVYIETPDFGSSDNLTLATWFKMTGRVGDWRALYTVNGWSPGWVHFQLRPDNQLGFSLNGADGGNDQVGAAAFDDALLDQWHHSTVVYSGTEQRIRFYLDGKLDSEVDWGGQRATLAPGRIGGWDGGGRGFQGLLDEFTIWRVAATPKQVKELAFDPNPPLKPIGPDTIVAGYSFDDGTALDNSGNGNDGVISNAVAAAGRVAGALEFDGSDQSYVATPDLGEVDELTIGLWFKPTGRASDWRVFYNVDGWSTGWVHHQLHPNNMVEFSIHSNTGGNDTFGETIFDEAMLDTWNHSALVYSSSQQVIRYYLNGELETDREWGGNPAVLGPARIGGWDGGGRGFEGLLDEVVILNIAATDEQVRQLASGTSVFDNSDPNAGGFGNAVNFGRVPNVVVDQDVQFEIINTGKTQTLTLSDFQLSGADADHFSLVETPAEVPADSSAAVRLTFNSRGELGLFSALLAFTTNDPDADDQNVLLPLSVTVENPEGPGAWFALDEADVAAPAIDQTGNGHAGAYVVGQGEVLLGQTGLTDAAGLAVKFSGGELQVGAARLNLSDGFTIALWLNVDSLGDDVANFGTIIGGGDTNPEFALLLGGGDLNWFGSEGVTLFSTATQPIKAQTTHHLAMRYDPIENVGAIFVDGVEVETGAVTAITGTGDLFFGAFGDGVLGMDGRLDDIQVFDRVLGPEAITFLAENPGRTLGEVTVPPTTTAGPSIIGVSRSATGVELLIGGVEGTLYDIEHSNDLIDWRAIESGLPGPNIEFTDDDAARLAAPSGFYRGVER